MDKQKQIEEMAKDIKYARGRVETWHCRATNCEKCGYKNCIYSAIAEDLFEKYQPKIPEGAVVLTKEEYDELKSLAKGHCEYCYLMDLPDFETERLVRDTTRKETAEKFAKDSKQRLKDKLHRGKALHTTVFGKEYVRRIFKEVIDEICKEITEGKYEKTIL